MKPTSVLTQVLEGIEKPPLSYPMHTSPMTGLPETAEAEMRQKDELPKIKIIILTSHFMDVELCFQGIMYGDDYFIF